MVLMNPLNDLLHAVKFSLLGQSTRKIAIDAEHICIILLTDRILHHQIIGFLQCLLCIRISSAFIIEHSKINIENNTLVREMIGFTIVEAIQIIVQSHRDITPVQCSDSHVIIATRHQVPFLRLIQVGQCLVHGLKKMFSVIEPIINLSTVVIADSHQLTIIILLSVFDDIIRIFKSEFRIRFTILHNLLNPLLNNIIILCKIHCVLLSKYNQKCFSACGEAPLLYQKIP